MLTVKDAVAAIDFDRGAFGAAERRALHSTVRTCRRRAVHRLGSRFFVVDENPDAFNLSPSSLGGGDRGAINLIVDDPDADRGSSQSAPAHARSFAVGDQPYGFRQGRVADPDGHHWLIGETAEPVSYCSTVTYTERVRGPSNSQKKMPCQRAERELAVVGSGTSTCGPISDARGCATARSPRPPRCAASPSPPGRSARAPSRSRARPSGRRAR